MQLTVTEGCPTVMAIRGNLQVSLHNISLESIQWLLNCFEDTNGWIKKKKEFCGNGA
jgi:hypothetical protein